MRDHPARQAVGLAVMTSAIGLMPVWLVSALAVQIGESLPLTEAGLGLAVALFMATSMIASLPAGYWIRAVGWMRGVRAVAVVGLVANGAVIAVSALWQLLVLMVVGGIANALAQPAANLSIVETVPTSRHGVAFGIKQAGAPGAMLVAGAAVPAIGLTVGWRWAFAALALVCALFGGFLRPSGRTGRAGQSRTTERHRAIRLPRQRRRALLVLGLSGCVATASATSLAAFAVTYATSQGIGPAGAGVLVAAASAVNIAVRLATGWMADRRGGGQLLVVAATMLVAALGYSLLAARTGPALVILGTLIAFGGWGWNGLFHMATMRSFPHHAAPATGAIVSAMAVGGAAGPGGFGLLVEATSYSLAWVVAALVAVVGSGLVLVARAMLHRTDGSVVLPVGT